MKELFLTNINNTFESYQSIISFYDRNKEKVFETIELELKKWFAANMCAALGAVLDLLSKENINQIKFTYIDDEIKTILLKNKFLSYYNFSDFYDTHHTTIPYLKLEKTDGKYFKNYVSQELINRPELPDISDLLKEKIIEGINEIFTNAQIHSESDYIYIHVGSFFQRNTKLSLLL